MNTQPPNQLYCLNKGGVQNEDDSQVNMTVEYEKDHSCYAQESVAASKGDYSKVYCDSKGCFPEENSGLRKEYDSYTKQMEQELNNKNIFVTLCCLGLVGFLLWNFFGKPTTTTGQWGNL
jgi:hypothetical protein